jgi:hypothetical protein
VKRAAAASPPVAQGIKHDITMRERACKVKKSMGVGGR